MQSKFAFSRENFNGRKIQSRTQFYNVIESTIPTKINLVLSFVSLQIRSYLTAVSEVAIYEHKLNNTECLLSRGPKESRSRSNEALKQMH